MSSPETHTHDFSKYFDILEEIEPIKVNGEVTSVNGLLVESSGPLVSVGSLCVIVPKETDKTKENYTIEAEVVGLREDKVLLMPLADNRGISKGMLVKLKDEEAVVHVSESLLGRVVNGLGEFIDDDSGYKAVDEKEYPLYAEPLNPLKRGFITEPLDVGVRSINSLFSIGKGQRIGIMAGSGVGKSVLLGMMARHTNADVNVIALIGERGREVREFITEILGEEGMKRSIVIVATSDTPPMVRIRATYLAVTIAEYFRDKGKDVLLMMDSITRFAMAQRELGLFLGEPPTSKGYTPSVFTAIPKVLERLGSIEGGGSITGLLTVLIEGDDINDPIGDAVRSVVDGHLFLSRKIAAKGLYPAVDILNSISRVMVNIVSPEIYRYSMTLKELMSVYQDSEDLINIGAYVAGANPRIDLAIKMYPAITAFIRQGMKEGVSFEQSIAELEKLMQEAVLSETEAGVK